jgi:gluconolactonase
MLNNHLGIAVSGTRTSRGNVFRTATGCLCLLLAVPGTSVLSEESPALDKLVSPEAKVVHRASGFAFAEGPAYSPEGFLIFSDIPNSRVLQRFPDGSMKHFIFPTGKANGQVYDAQGRLYQCRGGERTVVRFEAGTSDDPTVLAATYEDKRLNSPNDIALDDHGGFYFTDPRYGPQEGMEQSVKGVYYVDADGKITRIIEHLDQPNGILVSPDGSHLYVSETRLRQLHRFEILEPTKVSRTHLTYTSDGELDGGGPDGLALDRHGNVYATISTPELSVIGRIPVPKSPSNCAFGGAGNKTLFITARESLYSIRMRVAGFPLRPVTGASSATVVKETSSAKKTRVVKAGGLTLQVPLEWKQGTPTSTMRLAEFEIPPKADGGQGASLVLFHFGAGGAGSAKANIERWVGQFAPEGRQVTRSKGRSPAGDYTLVDISGTYNKPIGPPIRRQSTPVPDSRVINVMLDAPDGAYFFKLVGGTDGVGAIIPDLLRAFRGEPQER